MTQNNSINVHQLKKEHGSKQSWNSFVRYLFDNYEPSQFESSLWKTVLSKNSVEPLQEVLSYYQKHPQLFERNSEIGFLLEKAWKSSTFQERNIFEILKAIPKVIGYWINTPFLSSIDDTIFEKLKPFIIHHLPSKDQLTHALINYYHSSNPNFNRLKWVLENPSIFKNNSRISLEVILSKPPFLRQNKEEQHQIIDMIIQPILNHQIYPIGKGILYGCIRNKQTEILTFLLEKGFGIEPQLSEKKEILWACAFNNQEALELLLKNGVDPNQTSCFKGITTNVLGGLIIMGELIHKEYEKNIPILIEYGTDLKQALDDVYSLINQPHCSIELQNRYHKLKTYFEQEQLQKKLEPRFELKTSKSRL